MKKFYSLSICLALFCSVLIVGNLEAATYYIDGSNGNDSNPGTIVSPWKTIGKANSTLKAGDTVYLRAGTYTSQQIKPSHSGKYGNYITYQNYKEEAVTLSGGTYQCDLANVDYIKVDGIKFYSARIKWVRFSAASYNVIQNCTFDGCNAWSGIRFTTDVGRSDYNQILNCTFKDAPLLNPCPQVDGENDCYTAPADYIDCYNGYYNLIAGNDFGSVSHNTIMFDHTTKYNVARGNSSHNEFRSGFGIENVSYILIENNTFYDHGNDIAGDPSMTNRTTRRNKPPAIQLRGDNCIIRHNIFSNNGNGIRILGYSGAGANDGRIYQNTFSAEHSTLFGDSSSTDAYYGTIIKNNIFYDTQRYDYENKDKFPNCDNLIINNVWTIDADNFYYKSGTARTLSEVEAAYPTDWVDNVSANPLFADASGRDFTLQAGSLCIDAGTWLTTITSPTANAQTFFMVNDAGYFYDGWTIHSETGDVIKTQKGQVTTIQSINYDTNTITVSPAIDIVNGEGLALDYSGSAPDIGAYEYGTGLAPPSLLRQLSAN